MLRPAAIRAQSGMPIDRIAGDGFGHLGLLTKGRILGTSLNAPEPNKAPHESFRTSLECRACGYTVMDCSNCIARCWAGFGIVVIWNEEPLRWPTRASEVRAPDAIAGRDPRHQTPLQFGPFARLFRAQ
jgi:hypothetical protein